MRYKGILFDLDGTLIDSRRDLAEAVNVLRTARGLTALPIAEVAGHVGEFSPALAIDTFLDLLSIVTPR